MSNVGTITTFANGTVLNATDLNNNNTAFVAAINDNYANIASINSVIQQAGFTPSSAYNYFQTQFNALNASVSTTNTAVSLNLSNQMALFWMGGL